MQNCAAAAPPVFSRAPPSARFGPKLPQANMAVANSTSHGTRRAKIVEGVSSNSSAPSTPPTRLIPTSQPRVSPAAPLEFFQPWMPVAAWLGNSATEDVMLAARASMPVNIRVGRVMKEPPPARAFWHPAHMAAKNSTIRAVVMGGT